MSKSNVVRIASLTPLSSDLDAAIEGFVRRCQSKNLSPRTVEYYGFRLRAFQKFLDANYPTSAPADVTSEIVRAFLDAERESNSAATAAHSLTTLRVFFNFLATEGFVQANPMSGVEKPKCRKTVLSTFTLEQVESVLATCGKDFTGARDRALVMMMLDCGLRVTELCTLTLRDVNWTDQTLLVLGKGDRERVVPFGRATHSALTAYLARRGELETDTLFVSVYGEPMDRFRVRKIVAGRCEKAQVKGVRCSPHTLRHTCAVTYLRNGGDVFRLQKLLGHSSLDMTRKYAELSQTDVQDKHRMYSPADRLQSAKKTSGRTRLR